MAILPIDLQILYGQLDKVSKTAVQQQQGNHLQNVLNNERTTQKIQEKNNTVQETSMTGDGLTAVHDRNEQQNQSSEDHREDKKKEEELQVSEDTREIIKDPSLGKNIDISG